MVTCANNDLKLQIMSSTKCAKRILSYKSASKSTSDWYKCTEVLIDSYNCYYNGLEIIKIEPFTTIIGPENIKFSVEWLQCVQRS